MIRGETEKETEEASKRKWKTDKAGFVYSNNTTFFTVGCLEKREAAHK